MSKATEVLGWMPTTSLEAGIKETIEWYSKNILNEKKLLEVTC